MLEWLRRADSGRVFLDDGHRQLTYGEAAEKVAEIEVSEKPLRPQLTIESILEILATASQTTAFVLGPDAPEPEIGAPHTADFAVLTSGTSGSPKPISHTRANWEAAAEASMAHIGHGPEDIWLLALPLHHVAGLGIVLRSAYAGGTVGLLPNFEPKAYAYALNTVTVASVVPTMLIKTLDVHPGPYSGLRAVLVGGGPIPGGLLRRAHDAGIPALPTYGMTETCGQIATLKPGSAPARRAHALPGVHLRIGAEGRIEIKGPMVSEDVVDDHGWFLTGDLGYIDDEAALVVTGRADDMIITGGENVSPAAVEVALESIRGVEQAIVVGIPNEEWGNMVAAVFSGSAEIADLDFISLPDHARPRYVLKVESIPVTPMGKPDRVKIVGLFSATGV